MAKARLGLGTLIALALLSKMGCGDEEFVARVDVRTDLIAGFEFDEVTAERLGATDIESEGADGDWTRSRQVGEWDLPEGDYIFEVTAKLDGRDVVERRAHVSLTSDKSFTVLLTRDCRGIECPGDGGSPNETACLGGSCVDPACLTGEEDICGDVDASCGNTTECDPLSATCAMPVCEGGLCLAASSPGACEEGQLCSPDEGCVGGSSMMMDAGPDATDADSDDGGSDAGMDADSMTDADAESDPLAGCDSASIVIATPEDAAAVQAMVQSGTTCFLQIRIEMSASLSSLSFLSGLEGIGSVLSIEGVTGLTSLEGLESLREIGNTLRISFNPELTSIEALSNLERVGALRIEGNPLLGSLNGLQSLEEVQGQLLIWDNPSVTEIGLPALRTTGSFLLRNSPMVTSLSSLSFGEAPGGLAIEGMHGLSALDGPTGLMSTGVLTIDSNDGMMSLPALTDLEEITGALRVSFNVQLTTFELDSLNSLSGDFRVTSNSMLPDAEPQAVADRLVAGGYAGTVDINNGG